MTFTNWLADKHNINLPQERALFLTEQKVNTKLEDEEITNILMQSCLICGISFRDLIGKTRETEVVEVRHILMYLLRKRFQGVSLKTIGKYFGGRDHSTIIHASDKIDDLLDVGDLRVLELMNKLEPLFNNL